MTKLIQFLLKITYFASLLLLVLFVIQPIQGLSQTNGLPFIQNFSPSDYSADEKNYSIIRDGNGILYVSNEKAILEFDGVNWNKILIPGRSHIDIDSTGKLYIGAYNEFGIFKTDVQGKSSFHSLRDKMLKKENFGPVTNLVTYGDQVFFETNDKIYLYHHDYVQEINQKDLDQTVFKAGKSIFLNQKYKGLVIYENNRFENLPFGMFFRDKEIEGILAYRGKYLIKMINNPDLWLYDLHSLSKFDSELDQILERYTYSCMAVLPNDELAIGTLENGLYIISSKGEIMFNLNRNSGLIDNQVNNIYTDEDYNIWVSLQNGFSRIEYPSSYSFFGQLGDLEGKTNTLFSTDQALYAGTTNGIYKLPFRGNDTHFEALKGAEGTFFISFVFNNDLYFGGNQGIFKIKDHEAQNVFNQYCSNACVSRYNPGKLIVANSSWLSVLEERNGDLSLIGNKIRLAGEIRSIAEDINGKIWVGTNYYGVYQIQFSPDYSKFSIEHYNTDEILPGVYSWVEIYAYKNQLLYSTESGLFLFDPLSKKLNTESPFVGARVHDKTWINPLIGIGTDQFLGIARHQGENSELLFFGDQSGETKVKYIPFPFIDKFSFSTVYSDGNIVWLAGPEGVTRIDTAKTSAPSAHHKIIIRNLIIDNDSVFYIHKKSEEGKKRKDLIKFSYDLNSLRFNFAYPDFHSSEFVKYSHILNNLDEKWSEWSSTPFKEYNNLSSGKYVFKVKAVDVYGRESGVETYSFIVKPPFYYTVYAFISYALLIISFAFMVFKIRDYQFSKEKSELEKVIKNRTEELVREIERSEDLLVNMLPTQIANELKSNGKAQTRKYEQVSVLFSDIQGFTQIAELISPDVLVSKLDEFFQKVDAILGKYHIEKIKTIGDGYMCAGGIPVPNRTNPVEVCLTALEIWNIMDHFEFDRKAIKDLDWGLRIEVHTGPVIAGVIGDKKLSYDIWGTTVNTASRMESNGTPGMLNVSKSTYLLIRDFFSCQYHQSLTLKSGHVTDMYYVNRLKKEYSADELGRTPNEKLLLDLAELRYLDLYDAIIKRLENELPSNLYYHNVKHTIDVTRSAEKIGKSEGLSQQELLLLKTATLFHDMGFIIEYDQHEYHSVKLAKSILPGYHYSIDQIETVCELIMATKIPQQPKNKYEEIICDADLDYLGREDFIPVSKNLFLELYERKKIKSVDEWLKTQIQFIDKHTYFTKTAIETRSVNKKQQLENLQQMDFLTSFF